MRHSGDLTTVEHQVFKLEINEKKCEVCKHGVHLKYFNRYTCASGLKFPVCKGRVNGFMVAE